MHEALNSIPAPKKKKRKDQKNVSFYRLNIPNPKLQTPEFFKFQNFLSVGMTPQVENSTSDFT
jgi:hypothetical protein